MPDKREYSLESRSVRRGGKEYKMMLNRIREIRKRLEQSAACLKKNGKESALRGAVLLAGALVWWCVLYPELCFPQDTYEAVSEDAENMESEEPGYGGMEYRKSGPAFCQEGVLAEENCGGLLQAEEEQVIVKSRLLEWLEQSGYIK